MYCPYKATLVRLTTVLLLAINVNILFLMFTPAVNTVINFMCVFIGIQFKDSLLYSQNMYYM